MSLSDDLVIYPLPDGQYILDTDASNLAIGAVLSQIQDNEEKVLGYYSRVLIRPRKTILRNKKGVVSRHCPFIHPYLYGATFLLCTDHAALQWLLNFRSPEGQIDRWLERLQE